MSYPVPVTVLVIYLHPRVPKVCYDNNRCFILLVQNNKHCLATDLYSLFCVNFIANVSFTAVFPCKYQRQHVHVYTNMAT